MLNKRISFDEEGKEQINIRFPRWIEGLQDTNEIKTELFNEIKECFSETKKLKEINDDVRKLQSTQVITRTEISKIELGTGNVELNISMKEELFYHRGRKTEHYKMEELKFMVWRYFMSYWSNRRICSAIGGIPPAVKRQRFYAAVAVARFAS